MSGYNEEIATDHELGVNEILEECGMDDASWTPGDLPNTITLRRMIVLCDWVCSEPKRWQAYRLFYLDGIKSTTQIAQKLHISERTARRWLEPVHLRIKLKTEREKEKWQTNPKRSNSKPPPA